MSLQRRAVLTEWMPGIGLMGLGLIVMFGWLIRSSAITQVHPSFAPMQFNTALGFLLLGGGMACLNLSRTISRACGAILVALGLLTLSQYVFGIDLRIDQFFVEHYTTTKTSHPGRMAPNTALCFSLFGACLVVPRISPHVSRTSLSLIRLILSGLVLVLGLIAFLGYAFNLETSYGWGHLTRMAVHTSVGFMVAGLATACALVSSRELRGSAYYVPSLIGITMGAVSVTLWATLEAQGKHKLAQMLTFQAELLERQVETVVARDQSAIDRFVQRLRVGLPGHIVELDASTYLEDLPAVTRIEITRADANDLILNNAPMHRGDPVPFSQAVRLEYAIDAGSRLIVFYDPLQVLARKLSDLADPIGYEIRAGGKVLTRASTTTAPSLGTQALLHFRILELPVTVKLYSNGDGIPAYGGDGPLLTLLVGLVLSAVTVLTGVALNHASASEKALRRNQLLLEQEIESRKALQAKLEDNAAELKQTVEALEDFAYIASHDLKEPLRGIRHLVNFISEDNAGQMDQEGRDRLGRVNDQAVYLGRLIDDLLNYSRAARNLSEEMVELDDVVDQIVHSLAHMVEKEGVTLERAETLGTARCDRAAIGEVFRNLITNAIKYNDKPHKRIRIGCVQGAPSQYFVEDNGIGIDAEDHGRIFGIFSRLHGRDEYGGGTGAGLTIAKKIVESHGGAMTVESSPGKGTRFSFTLT